ncbi:hypothetical protein GGR52DRAFT_57209 [Hypoxylon sp. FL1284]|nr:hypothetical protein GGR52DRAFT_57209 [Hypoxylon sp. FL1284]
MGEISGLKRISTQSNGIGWALGCLVCFLSSGHEMGVGYAHGVLGLQIQGSCSIRLRCHFSVLVLRLWGTWINRSHFSFALFPRQRVFQWVKVHGGCHPGTGRGVVGDETRCLRVYRKNYWVNSAGGHGIGKYTSGALLGISMAYFGVMMKEDNGCPLAVRATLSIEMAKIRASSIFSICPSSLHVLLPPLVSVILVVVVSHIRALFPMKQWYSSWNPWLLLTPILTPTYILDGDEKGKLISRSARQQLSHPKFCERQPSRRLVSRSSSL